MDRTVSFMAVCITASHYPTGIHGEIFSATVQLPKLLQTQKILIDRLDDFLEREDHIVLHLRIVRDNLQSERHIANNNRQRYIENPINAFKLIKRLTVDVQQALENIDLLGSNIPPGLFPTDADLVGVSEALVRLQETYQLKTADLARGYIHNEQYSTTMSSSDCFSLGGILFDKGLYYYSSQWFREILEKIKSESTPAYNARRVALEYIAFNDYGMDDLEEGLAWLETIIKEYPNQEDIAERRNEWQRELTQRQKNNEITSFKDDKTKKEHNVLKAQDESVYEALCRGERPLPIRPMKQLICRLDNDGHPYLKIAPFKMEELFSDPDILIYHEVMNDYEIDHIKTLAISTLERAIILTSDESGKSISKVDMSRVSQVSWLGDADDGVVARVSRRAGHIAHLDIDSSEPLQASIYGVGGHFTPHYDMSLKTRHDEEYLHEIGNRMATVMFYMSDVKRGGYTAFTRLGIAVRPRRGSALVWRNLLLSTEADLRTRHAACPVLLGSKWVLNKWLHEFGQEFIAPCSLEYQEQEDEDD